MWGTAKAIATDRKKEIINVNCLGTGHFIKESISCRKCTMHNTLLHRDTESQSKMESEPDAAPVITHCTDESIRKSRLSTKIEDDENLVSIYYTGRHLSFCLLHECTNVLRHRWKSSCVPSTVESRVSIESDDRKFCKKLRLQPRMEHRSISGINQARTNASKVVKVRIKFQEFSTNLECVILPVSNYWAVTTNSNRHNMDSNPEEHLADHWVNNNGE